MDNFVHAILMNAVLATISAAAVAIACRFIRQPSIVRALWLLVLLRLAVPPLIGLPVPVPILTADTPLPTIAARRPVLSENQPAVSRPESAPGTSSEDQPLQSPQVVTHHSTSLTPTCAVPSASWKWPSWCRLLLALWLFGTVTWCTVTLVRVARFSRWLRQAKPAPTRLTGRAREIATQLGLRSCPELLVVSGRISPSLWGWGGRTCILLPRDLLTTLKVDQHDMLVAHELSHYRRGDHWCRWFEVVMLAVYWWHPIAWLARTRMLQAEEECCDACVLWTFPKRVRTYAETLLATVDFLLPSPSVVAPAATKISVFPLLKRRLEMILHDRPRHRMTTLTKACLASLALAALSLSPTLLADKTTPEDAEKQVAATAEQKCGGTGSTRVEV
jgi:beta-lactamase regulating signal transducer with metallopeptidase domain